jgi:hypothetical protein
VSLRSVEDSLRHAEEAIAALGRGDAPLARSAAIFSLASDRSLYALADIIALAAAELEAEGEISPATWNALGDASPEQLRPIIEMWRS